MSLPPLPPLTRPSYPTCKVCNRMSTRQVQTVVGVFLLCDTCEAPDVVDKGPVTRLPALMDRSARKAAQDFMAAARKLPGLPTLPPLPSLAPLPAPKAPSPATMAMVSEALRTVSSAIYPDCPPARVLVADPPWQFGDNTPHKGADDHYKTMPIEEIKAFPLPPLADDAVIFMWRVGGGNEADGSLGEQAYSVMRAWGFTPKSELCWQKTLTCKTCDGQGYATDFIGDADKARGKPIKIWCEECSGRGYKNALGMGRYVRGCHEICLIGTRGKAQFPDDKGVRSIIQAPRGPHSAKPDRFYERVERLYQTGPYVELFARRRREGWHCFGDELKPLEEQGA